MKNHVMNKIIYQIIILIAVLLTTIVRSNSNPEEKASIESYSSLSDAKIKMEFCVNLLSTGRISRGMRIENLVEIFGEELRVPEGFSKGRKSCFLYFERQHKNTDPSYSSDFVGWYACFEIQENGKLVNYWLSNLHK